MSETRVHHYAQALLEVIAAEGHLNELQDELFRFSRVIEGNDELREALTDPHLPAARRTQICEDLLGGKASDVTVALVSLVVGTGRARDLPAIVNRLLELTASEGDRSVAEVRSAVDLLRNIEHRRQTIYRVVECIVDRQREFLDYGVEHIKPMMLKDVAEDIGMHLSTISRVVNRKYAHTPQGVIELRRFFSEGMLNEEGEEVSTRILKLRIKKMIEEEDTKRPLTDDEIAKVLSKEGVKLSRRTVAKYRDQMQIPGSRERKTII